MPNSADKTPAKLNRNKACAKATKEFVQSYKNPPLSLIDFTKWRIFAIMNIIWEGISRKNFI